MTSSPEDGLLRLAEHLASLSLGEGQQCTLAGVMPIGNYGRCSGEAVAIRWEMEFADEVCEMHAQKAKDRGVLIVYPKRHDGGSR